MKLRIIVAAALTVAATVIATLALPASALPGNQAQPSRCARFVASGLITHGRTNGHESLSKWSRHHKAGDSATIYTTLYCDPATAYTLSYELYIDQGNLLAPMPKGLELWTQPGNEFHGP